MSARVRKIRVVLKVSKYNIPLFLACCQAIHAAMLAHQADYAGSPVTLASFLLLIQALADAQLAVRKRTIGAAAARDEARDALFIAVEALRTFVQGLCQASPEKAVTLAQNAGMKIAAVPAREQLPLEVKQGPHPGIVVLLAHVALLGAEKGGCFFNWEYSADGKNWIAVPSTPKASTTISGLTPLTNYGFRVSLTGNSGQGGWSQIVDFLVH